MFRVDFQSIQRSCFHLLVTGGFVPRESPVCSLGVAHHKCAYLTCPISFIEPGHYGTALESLDVGLQVILSSLQHFEESQAVLQPILLSVHHLLLGIQDLGQGL